MDKLQRAGRDFLMRLVAQHGLDGAARMLRALADELEALCRTSVPPDLSARARSKEKQVVACDRGAGH